MCKTVGLDVAASPKYLSTSQVKESSREEVTATAVQHTTQEHIRVVCNPPTCNPENFMHSPTMCTAAGLNRQGGGRGLPDI